MGAEGFRGVEMLEMLEMACLLLVDAIFGALLNGFARCLPRVVDDGDQGHCGE
jgi:hypothetical protein